MARSTGIEITETSIRVSEIDGSARKFKIVGAAEAAIEADENGARSQEASIAALKAACKAARARKEQVVFGLPSSKAVVREILIPFTDPEQIRKVIKFESESHLPAGNIDDVIVAYHKVGEQGPRSRILIIAVQKKVLKEYLEILGRAGIDPTHIDLDAAGLFALSKSLPGLESDDEALAQVIVDIGQTITTVMIGTGLHLRMVRSVRLGAETLTRTLSHDLGIEQSEARTVTASILKTNAPFATGGEVESSAGTGALSVIDLKNDIVKDRQADFVRRIANEIRRSLTSLQLDGRLSGVWLTGPASTAPGLETGLAEVLGTEVKPLDTLANADHNLPVSGALTFGTSIGLALKPLDHDLLRLDFRQEDLRFARKLERIKTPLTVALVSVLVLFAFLSIVEFARQKNQKNNLQYLVNTGRAIFEDAHVNPAKKSPEILSIFGYANAQAIEDALTRISKVATADQVGRMLGALVEPADKLKTIYGVNLDGEESNQSPETEARSALYRLDQFAGVLERCKEKTGKIEIDKLDVHSTKIVWTMQCSSANVDTFAILKDEFVKLDGYVAANNGKISSVGDKQKYETATIEFTPER